MKNILFVGLGSAGQRHLRIVKSIFKEKKINFFCLRSTKRNLIIDDELKTKKVNSVSNYYKIKKISEREISNFFFDVVFITSPIYKHLDDAIRFAKLGSNLFIEKPISNNLEKINTLRKIAKKKKITICVGYQLRFHPGIQFIKKNIKEFGKLISGSFHFGEYLPNMHKYEDYRKTHMAKKKEGGGAVLCLSHEVDLLRYILGDPKIIKTSISKISNLNIDVEDTLEAQLMIKKKSSINLKINFLDNPPIHFIALVFKKKKIIWDYIGKKLIIIKIKDNSYKEINYKKFRRNKMFELQLKNFFNSIYGKEKLMTNLEDGIKTLKLCIKLKKNGIKKL
jgi:predicted dehydrogenase